MKKVRKTGGRRPGRTESRMDGRRVGRTETRTDGHHHTIIRPVRRRAYKNQCAETSVHKTTHPLSQ